MCDCIRTKRATNFQILKFKTYNRDQRLFFPHTKHSHVVRLDVLGISVDSLLMQYLMGMPGKLLCHGHGRKELQTFWVQ